MLSVLNISIFAGQHIGGDNVFHFVMFSPPASSLCVPVLVLGKKECFLVSYVHMLFPNLESQTVVTLAPATVETSLVKTSLVVVALVVEVALVVVALVVVPLVEVVIVSVVEAVGVTVVVAASPTIIVIPTKENPAHSGQE